MKKKKKEVKTWPKKEKKAEKVAEVIPDPVLITPETPLCHCGRVVAEGQTEVCRDHIRTN